jgi:F1F0 ATPase subunit 2
MTHLGPLAVAGHGVLGALSGLVYFSALGWNVRFYASRGAGGKALGLHVLRFVGIVVIFAICARQGAASLLSGLVGFLAIRTFAIAGQRISVGSDT